VLHYPSFILFGTVGVYDGETFCIMQQQHRMEKNQHKNKLILVIALSIAVTFKDIKLNKHQMSSWCTR
jgi:hypothetical protein